jgi:hypothetical protein
MYWGNAGKALFDVECDEELRALMTTSVIENGPALHSSENMLRHQYR